jgi:hypothetical protein
MSLERLIFERADARPELGAAYLISAVHLDVARRQIIRESHVFVPAENVHRHEIVCLPAPAECTLEQACDLAREATRGLLHRFLEARISNSRWHPAHSRPLVVRRLDSHPFHELLLAGGFREELWSIQDWTTSGSLRSELAKVASYHSDHAETELFARIFSAQQAGPQAAL